MKRILAFVILISCGEQLSAQITDSLALEGIFQEITELNPTSEIYLDEGWNMFGIGACHNPQDISFFDDYEQIVSIKDYKGNIYLPSWGFDNIGQLEVGKAYWIKLTAPLGPISFCEGVVIPPLEFLDLNTLNLPDIYQMITWLNPPIEHYFEEGWNMFETGCANPVSVWEHYYNYYDPWFTNFKILKDDNGFAFFVDWTFGDLQTLNGMGEGFQAKAEIDFGPVSFCEGVHLPIYPGCIDEQALNYNALASEDDGTCTY